MMQSANYHSHSEYSDGHFLPVVYMANAISKKMKAYGFSEHAYIPGWDRSTASLQDQLAYLTNVEKLKKQYRREIQIYKGLEVDYIPGVLNVDSPLIQKANLDYTIGAVHYVDYFKNGTPWAFEHSFAHFREGVNEIFGGDIRSAVGRYYELIREMVTNHCPTIVAHLDRIKKLNKNNSFFDESESWYRKEVVKTMEVIAQSGAIMEINTKGFYKNEAKETYPGMRALLLAKEMNIPVHLGSDAHHPYDIDAGFEYAGRLLKEAGIKTVKLLLDNEWKDIELKDTFQYAL